MKKMLGFAVALSALMMVGSVQAAEITINYTSDNRVNGLGVCTDSCDPYLLGAPAVFPGANFNDWTDADTATFDLDPGTYTIGFNVANDTGPAGFLAEILWQGNTNVSSSAWEVSNNGSVWYAATDLGGNGSAPWGNNLVGEIGAGSRWIWDAAPQDLEAVYFRTNITVAVPEPGTFALLGLGLAGLGFSRRKQS